MAARACAQIVYYSTSVCSNGTSVCLNGILHIYVHLCCLGNIRTPVLPGDLNHVCITVKSLPLQPSSVAPLLSQNGHALNVIIGHVFTLSVNDIILRGVVAEWLISSQLDEEVFCHV